MATIDERIVSIAFENSKFEANVAHTMGTLDRLNHSISNVSKTSGLDQLEASSNRLSFGGATRAIDGIGHHFSTVQTAAAVAFGNIAAVAAEKGAEVVKSFAIDPILEGFHNYETQINAVQTIQANTGLSGKKGMDQISSALNNLNRYANLTVYNFSEMARNIGTFTAAGVKLGPATESIKGIANLAAMSGSTSQQASGAMYQLSQAIAAGKVNLQDWNSVVNAGIGGKVFQDALIRTGVAMGTIAKGAVEIDKKTGQATINGNSFRQSLQVKPGEKSWLTSDVLVKTLGQFTGDMTKAQLAAEGFNASQIQAIQSQAKVAVNAATQVKTFSQLMQALKEEVGSAWANIFKTLFGNLGQAKTLFSGLHTFLENALTGPLLNFNKILEQWAKMGGRTDLLEGLKQAFKDLQAVFKPVQEAFRDIFPPTTARSLLELTKGFENLMERLRISSQTGEELRRTFRGVFAVLDIGWTIVKDLVKVFFDLFQSTGPAAGGLLGVTANIGDFLTKVDRAVTKGGALAGVFQFIESVIKVPIRLIGDLASAIGSLFSGKDVSGAAHQFGNALGGLGTTIGPLGGILTGISHAWDAFVQSLGKVRTMVAPFLKEAGDAVRGFTTSISDAVQHANWGNVFAAVQTGILGGIFLAIKKALSGGGPIDEVIGGFRKIVGGANEVIEGVSGNLEHLQKAIQVATLLEIAAAMGILAGAIFILSTINPRRITEGLGAVAVGLGEMVAAMILLKGATTGGMSMPLVAGSIVLLASAMVILAVAMKIFATMSWEEIAKGLTGVAGGLSAVGLATKLISGPNIIAAGLALIPLATGLALLGGAMKVFATMSWQDLAKGISGISVALAGIGLAMKLMPLTLPLTAAGLIILSAGLAALSGAIRLFSLMDVGKTAISIGEMAGALVVLGLAVSAIPPTLAFQAAGLIILSAALSALAGAIAIFGHMNILTVAKGVIEMASAIVILGLALTTMSGTLPGSVALLAAAGAFAVLAPALALMGNLDIGTILKGLGAMAGVLITLGIAGAIAGPAFVVLGVGILAIGAGLAAVGGAVFLFAKGISLLSDTSVKAMAALIAAVGAFVAVFPSMVINFVKGLVQILSSIVSLAPRIVSGLVSIASDLLDGLVKIAPKVAVAVGAIVTAVIKILSDNFDPILKIGIKLFEQLLVGIGQNIGKITDEATNLIVNFVGGLTKNMPRILRAGANLIVSFVNGVASGLGRVLDAGGNLVAHFITGLGSQYKKIILAGGTAITNFITGLGNSYRTITRAAVTTAGQFIDALVNAIVGFVDRVYKGVIRLMNGLAAEIRKNNKPLWDAGWNIAWAIVQGVIDGLGSLAGHIVKKVEDIAKSIPEKFLHILGIHSPSSVMMEIGKNTMLGLSSGIDSNFAKVDDSMATAAGKVVNTAKAAFGKIPDALAQHIDTNPTITPVLDLSGVKKDAATLHDLLPAQKIAAVVSSDQAATISQKQGTAAAKALAAAPTTHVTFNQTNNSPEPLPAIEIYRQTKNQLAQVKTLVGA